LDEGTIKSTLFIYINQKNFSNVLCMCDTLRILYYICKDFINDIIHMHKEMVSVNNNSIKYYFLPEK